MFPFARLRFRALRRAPAALLSGFLLLLPLFAALPAGASASSADDGKESAPPLPGDDSWTLSADKLVSLDDGVIVEASGDVLLRRGEDYLKAEFARYFTTTNWVFVRGDVQVKLGRDELKAAEAEFDLGSDTGWLRDGSVFMAGPHIYFTGGEVIKHWGDRYTFRNARVTACDGPVPAWSVAAREAVVEIDGYATLSHTTLQVLDKGIFFTPFLVLPAKTTRQSGLLQPDMGVSSQHGAYVTVPWYQVLDESRDLTLYGTWLERTGVMPSVEYRSHTGDNDRTWLALDAMYDSKPFDNDFHDPVDDTDGKVRTNYTRYWLRGMSQGRIANSDWHYKYNLDFTSDQNFLREFKTRMTGYDATQRELSGFFGRDLQELDKNRVTEGYLFRDWERVGLTIGGRYEQDPSLGHGNASRGTDTTPQHLPEFTAYLYKGRLAPDLPLELEASGTAAYLYRATGTRGLRLEAYPRLSLPLDLKYATIIASGGIRQTLYHSSRASDTSPLHDSAELWARQEGKRRTIPDVDLMAFTQASRVWQTPPSVPLEVTPANAGQSRWTAVRHLVQPRLHYSWVPNVRQERNPFYTLDDRILPENEFYFTLTNLFTVRRQTVVTAPAPAGQPPSVASLASDYLDIARVRMGLGYDLAEASRNRHRQLFPRRPFTDLMLDATFYPRPWLSFWTQTYLSLYGHGVTRSDEGLTLIHNRWGSLSMGYSARNRYYDYRRQVQYENLEDVWFEDSLSLLRNEINLTLSPRWHVGFLTDTNLNTGRTYERRINLTYIDQCFRIMAGYLSSGRERSFRIGIELMGIN